MEKRYLELVNIMPKPRSVFAILFLVFVLLAATVIPFKYIIVAGIAMFLSIAFTIFFVWCILAFLHNSWG